MNTLRKNLRKSEANTTFEIYSMRKDKLRLRYTYVNASINVRTRRNNSL